MDPAAPPGALTDVPKPGDPAAPKPATETPAIPETYDFKPPERDGKPLELDPALVTSFADTAKAAGLTQAQFQALGEHGAALIAEQVAKAAGAPLATWHATQREWQDAVKADPEIGGAKLQENLGFAAAAIDKLGGDNLRHALNVTGGGNNPAMVKAFAQMGRMMADPSTLSTGRPANGARPKSGEQTARDLYNQGGGNYPDLPA